MTITESQELLLKAVKANRLAAAYLFVGAEREERRVLAKFLTQALFCSEITPGSLPCNHSVITGNFSVVARYFEWLQVITL